MEKKRNIKNQKIVNIDNYIVEIKELPVYENIPKDIIDTLVKSIEEGICKIKENK